MRKKLLFGQSYYSDKTLKHYLTIRKIYIEKLHRLKNYKLDKIKYKVKRIQLLIELKMNEIKILDMLWIDAKKQFNDKTKLKYIKNNLDYRKEKMKAKIKYLKKLQKLV